MATKKRATAANDEPDAMPEYTPLPQINLKKIGCQPKQAVRLDKPVYMARIYGECTSVKTKDGRNGDPYSYLVGMFRAVTPDGKKWETEKLFLPGGIMEAVESQWESGGKKPVQFGYDILAVPDDNSVGYRYSAKSLIKTESSDRLAGMSSSLESAKMPKEVATTS
jgi:hypothetical protein